MLGEPGLHCLSLIGRVVVDDAMKIEQLRHHAIDLFEDLMFCMPALGSDERKRANSINETQHYGPGCSVAKAASEITNGVSIMGEPPARGASGE
jgi:hypothetical protein